jgi:hypothetical protein
MAFDQQHLVDLGFVGFVPLRNLEAKSVCVPTLPGVYAVTLAQRPVEFLARSPGGRFKGKDPTVTIDRLQAKWIDDCETVYIGRASSLRERLGLLARFGRGDAVGHWGGRYLWQLAALDDLKVCWHLAEDPVAAERHLLEDFEASFGVLPFANLVRGTRSALAA